MKLTGTPEIFDCFIFFNENDLLELRLEELGPVVDKHVLIQSNETFRGKPKPDYLDYERFQSYIDSGKLVVHTIPSFPEGLDPWAREHMSRNVLADVLKNLHVNEEDFVILSDADEIPRRSAIANMRVCEVSRIRLDKYSYAINMLTGEGNTSARVFRYLVLDEMTPQQIRESLPDDVIENGGWEFSSLGTAKQIMEKFKAFAHSEFDGEISASIFRNRMRRGRDLLDRDISMTPVEIDDSWPEAIKNNRDYWRVYEWSA